MDYNDDEYISIPRLKEPQNWSLTIGYSFVWRSFWRGIPYLQVIQSVYSRPHPQDTLSTWEDRWLLWSIMTSVYLAVIGVLTWVRTRIRYLNSHYRTILPATKLIIRKHLSTISSKFHLECCLCKQYCLYFYEVFSQTSCQSWNLKLGFLISTVLIYLPVHTSRWFSQLGL